MDAMDKETQAELDRLEREIWSEEIDLTEIMADDVLKDLDALLAQEAAEQVAQQPEVREAAPVKAEKNHIEVYDDFEDDEEDDYLPDEESKDGLTIGLLITASALCVGIIGVMIYWLENFL